MTMPGIKAKRKQFVRKTLMRAKAQSEHAAEQRQESPEEYAQTEVQQDKLDAAVAKVLEAVPELCGGAGTGSTGNFARRNGNAEDALDAKIRENIMGAY